MKRLLVGTALLAAASGTRAAHAQHATLDWPLGIGLRSPSYDRVDGATIPFGPTLIIGEERVTITPVIAYRSHLGAVDPSLAVKGQLTPALSFTVSGARGTVTNDAWIRSNLANSAVAFATGHDARNYFRADRLEGWLELAPARDEERSLTFGVGARFENGWSTGWRAGEMRGPYALIHRNDEAEGIQRPNPLIDDGHIESYLARATGVLKSEVFSTEGRVELEAARNAPGGGFTQLTAHDELTIPTFLGQRVELLGHLLATVAGTPAPRQRYGYLGGSGTLVTRDLLSMGGDRLYFMEAAYVVPIPVITLPLVGSPYVAARVASGAASVGHFGPPTNNVGGRIGFGPLRVDFMIDPHSHRRRWGYGVSFER